jgi:anaerobic ribonucleoside-triphosphate reductase activating protein|tara:strand:+ start:36 stop:482 length:447 start_codon:yes stop_codon:yes gene_type:complete
VNLIVRSIDFSGSIADGPGVRSVLFVQGCRRRCPDCHNPETWPLDAGSTVPVAELAGQIRSRAFNKKLTISGGEPLLQADAVLALLERLPDFDVALYTGADLGDVPEELLARLDYIKAGRYDREKRTTTTPYVGSSNQQFIALERRRR